MGATVYDFAAATHSHIMLRTKSAMVNGIEVLPTYRLQHGDIVRIIMDHSIRPELNWFDHIHTTKARSALKKE